VRLPARDFAMVQDAMLALHERRDVEALRAAAPAIFLGVVPGDRFAWGEGDFGGPGQAWRRVVFWESPARMTPALQERLGAMMGGHPFNVHGLQTGHWGPLMLSDFMTRRELMAWPIYREVYRHIGVGHLISCGLFRGKRVGTISISRPLRARPFAERDRLALRLLMPHFEHALRDAELRTAMQGTRQRPLPAFGFTPREVEVAVWLARGRTNPEIATILGMRPRTVEKHVENILGKLGVENRTAAAIVIAGSASLNEAPPSPAGSGPS